MISSCIFPPLSVRSWLDDSPSDGALSAHFAERTHGVKADGGSAIGSIPIAQKNDFSGNLGRLKEQLFSPLMLLNIANQPNLIFLNTPDCRRKYLAQIGRFDRRRTAL